MIYLLNPQLHDDTTIQCQQSLTLLSIAALLYTCAVLLMRLCISIICVAFARGNPGYYCETAARVVTCTLLVYKAVYKASSATESRGLGWLSPEVPAAALSAEVPAGSESRGPCWL